MNILRATILILIGCLTTAGAAHALSLGGYYENQLNVQRLNGEDILFDSNKLRLDLAHRYEGAAFGADLIYVFYAGDKRLYLDRMLPTAFMSDQRERIDRITSMYGALIDRIGELDRAFALSAPSAQSLEDTFFDSLTYELEDRFYVDNAYVRLSPGRFDITVGKQQLPWGTGYAWNPTDLFNTKNIFDPTYEKEGVTAVKIAFTPVSMAEILAALVFLDWEEAIGFGDHFEPAAAFRVKGDAAGFDFSLSYLQRTEYDFDMESQIDQAEAALEQVLGLGRLKMRLALPEIEAALASEGLAGMEMAPLQRRRHVAGADLVGEINGVGIWAEAAFSVIDEPRRDWWEVLVGTDYTFDFETHVMAEYYYNGRGRSRAEDYTLNDWMSVFSSTVNQIGRHYIFAGGDHPVTDLSTMGIYGILNAGDLSCAAMINWTWSLYQDIELNLNAIYTGGPERAEFSVGPVSLWARLTAYF